MNLIARNLASITNLPTKVEKPITTRLEETSMTVISLSFLVTNLFRHMDAFIFLFFFLPTKPTSRHYLYCFVKNENILKALIHHDSLKIRDSIPIFVNSILPFFEKLFLMRFSFILEFLKVLTNIL